MKSLDSRQLCCFLGGLHHFCGIYRSLTEALVVSKWSDPLRISAILVAGLQSKTEPVHLVQPPYFPIKQQSAIFLHALQVPRWGKAIRASYGNAWTNLPAMKCPLEPPFCAKEPHFGGPFQMVSQNGGQVATGNQRWRISSQLAPTFHFWVANLMLENSGRCSPHQAAVLYLWMEASSIFVCVFKQNLKFIFFPPLAPAQAW